MVEMRWVWARGCISTTQELAHGWFSLRLRQAGKGLSQRTSILAQGSSWEKATKQGEPWRKLPSGQEQQQGGRKIKSNPIPPPMPTVCFFLGFAATSVIFPVAAQLLYVRDGLKRNGSDPHPGQHSWTKGVWVGEGQTGRPHTVRWLGLTSPVQLGKLSTSPSVGSACIPFPYVIVISCAKNQTKQKTPTRATGVCKARESHRKHNGKNLF